MESVENEGGGSHLLGGIENGAHERLLFGHVAVRVFRFRRWRSSTRMPTARARPPRVMTLMVSPSAARMTMEVAIESGMDVQTMSVERQEPRKSRIIRPVSAAAMVASRTTSEIDSRTKMDWSKSGTILSAGGRPGFDPGDRFLDAVDDGEGAGFPRSSALRAGRRACRPGGRCWSGRRSPRARWRHL